MESITRRGVLRLGGAAGVTGFPGLVFAQAPPERRELSSGWTPEKLAAALLPREQWTPFPPASQRSAWEKLPGEVRNELIRAGEAHLGKPWPVLPASVFLEFARSGNRSGYEGIRSARRERLRELAIAECAEGKGRFLDEILNGIWATCEETYWGVPAHVGMQKAGSGLPDVEEPTVDLFAGETSSLLAWIDYLLGPHLERLSPLLRPRIRLEITRRILTPNLEREDFWWMGLGAKRAVNNWNPWINSNWLASVLLIESDAKRRIAAVHKILRSLDRFLDVYHPDGGCDEGPSYWGRAGASLFDCLELLYSASKGAIQFYDRPLVQEIGRYIYRAHIYGDYFVNFADAPARVRLNGDLVFRYGRRIGDEKMQALGAYAARERGGAWRGDSIGRQLEALFNLEALAAAPARQPLVRDVWLPGIQVMAARVREGSAGGLYLAAQGGHNAESHNHNDVGNFIVYADGRPVLIDVGVETYTAKTFSAQRYDIWTMQSAYHNLPAIDGVMQAAGRQYEARDVRYRSDDRAAEFRLDIAKAYPPEAGVRFWRRTLKLDRVKNEIEVVDDCELAKPAREIAFTLMTPCSVRPGAPGELALEPGVKIFYDASLAPSVEEIPLQDARLRSSWGGKLFRILLKTAKPVARAAWSLRVAQ